MEMIQDKISRLTPYQQREVEDFIDFLIARDSITTGSIHNHEDRDEVTRPAPVIFAEERPVTVSIDQDILPDYPEYTGAGTICKKYEPERQVEVPRRVEKEPGKLLDWID